MTGDLATDPEARFEFLCDHGVFVEEADGTVATTEGFDAVRGIFHDTYADVDDGTFHATVASLFGLPADEAAERVAELGVTRAELVAYLALESHLDDVAPRADVGRDARVHLAAMVAGVEPESPIPDATEALTDEEYGAFLDANPDAVVLVWKRHCEPCDAMKDDLEEILAAVPKGVAVGGVDGEAVPAFRREFGVSAAPATLAFADGTLVERVEGRRSVDQLAATFADAYDVPSAVD